MSMPGVHSTEKGLSDSGELELWMIVHHCVSAGTSGIPAAKVAVCHDQEALSTAKNGKFPLSAGFLFSVGAVWSITPST